MAAALRLYVGSNPLQDGTVKIHRMLESWTPGTGTGTSGVASASERAAGVSWSSAMSSPVFGLPSSRDDVVYAEFAPATANAEYSVMLPPALVQHWIEVPAENHGVMLECLLASSGINVYFETSQAADPLQRPELVIDYRPGS